MSDIILLACGDIHLSESAPSIRSAEPDWFSAQYRQLKWLSDKAEEHECPIVIAGDIFDKAVGTTRLVNFVIDSLPKCYAIAGNHDLPNHNYDNLKNASYGTLIRTGNIINLRGITKINVKGKSIALHGFPYNDEFKPCEKQCDIDIAVVHAYTWTNEMGVNVFANNSLYSNSHYTQRMEALPGYDYYIFGDCHSQFIKGNFINCGSFYRRTKREIDFRPSVIAIHLDGSITTIPIPTDQDVVVVPTAKSNKVVIGECDAFFESLKLTGDLMCDAESILEDYLRKNEVARDVWDAVVDIRERVNDKIRPK